MNNFALKSFTLVQQLLYSSHLSFTASIMYQIYPQKHLDDLLSNKCAMMTASPVVGFQSRALHRMC